MAIDVLILCGSDDIYYAHKLENKLGMQGVRFWVYDYYTHYTRFSLGDQNQIIGLPPTIDVGRLNRINNQITGLAPTIEGCKAILVIMSTRAALSENLQKDIDAARKANKTIYPLLLEGAPWKNLIDIQYVDVTHGGMPPRQFINTIKDYLQKSDNSTSGTSPIKTAQTQPLELEKGNPNTGTEKAIEKSQFVFISYRRSDSADVTGRIYDRLIGRFGKDPIFKDVDSIPLGIDFKEYLDQKVGECVVLLAVIGDHWLDARDADGNKRLDDPADFVRIEIQSALERGIPVIPLLVRGAQMPSEANLPPSLQKLVYRNGIPVRSDPDFHRDMDRLIAGLEKYMK